MVDAACTVCTLRCPAVQGIMSSVLQDISVQGDGTWVLRSTQAGKAKGLQGDVEIEWVLRSHAVVLEEMDSQSIRMVVFNLGCASLFPLCLLVCNSLARNGATELCGECEFDGSVWRTFRQYLCVADVLTTAQCRGRAYNSSVCSRALLLSPSIFVQVVLCSFHHQSM